MATSAKQLAANRANAKKSTGPRTELGKRISRMNSTTHGLCGHTVLKTPEDDAAYRTYYHRLMPDLSPANAVEQDFAERIIYDSWRIHRASAIESNIFALAEAAFDTGNAAQDDALNEPMPSRSTTAPSAYSASTSSASSAACSKIWPPSKPCRKNASRSPSPLAQRPRLPPIPLKCRTQHRELASLIRSPNSTPRTTLR